jgi:hypothetical protein
MKTEAELNQVAEKIIGAAIEVHRALGPGSVVAVGSVVS